MGNKAQMQQVAQRMGMPVKKPAVRAASHPGAVTASQGVTVTPFKKVQTKYGPRVLPPQIHLPRAIEEHHFSDADITAMQKAKKAAAATKRADEKAKAIAAERKKEANWTEEDWEKDYHERVKNNPVFKHARAAGFFDKKKAKKPVPHDPFSRMYSDGDRAAALLKNAGMNDYLAPAYKDDNLGFIKNLLKD